MQHAHFFFLLFKECPLDLMRNLLAIKLTICRYLCSLACILFACLKGASAVQFLRGLYWQAAQVVAVKLIHMPPLIPVPASHHVHQLPDHGGK